MNISCYPIRSDQSGAVHEAGHAVFCVALGRNLSRISLVREVDGDGRVDHEPIYSTDLQVVEEVAIMLAGGAAADLWGFVTNTGSDEERASKVLSDRFPDRETDLMREQIRACVRQATEALVWPITMLAMGLLCCAECDSTRAEQLIRGTLTGVAELKECLKQISLPIVSL